MVQCSTPTMKPGNKSKEMLLENIRFYYMSHVVRKSAFCIYKNKDTDQLRGNREADQRL